MRNSTLHTYTHKTIKRIVSEYMQRYSDEINLQKFSSFAFKQGLHFKNAKQLYMKHAKRNIFTR